MLGWQDFKYCVVLIVKNNSNKFTRRLIVVYGSPYEETKLEFIDELHLVMGNWEGPTLVGGDFNLVRTQKEKKTMGLIEIKDQSRSYSWSNNQASLVMATLDRTLASVEWEHKYPLAQVTMLSKGVNDHNPLLIKIGEQGNAKDPLFGFEKWWLEVEGFVEVVKKS
jgi:hypothetical protein